MKKTRRRFTTEFKREAVRRLLESGQALEAIARELGVTPASLFDWRKEFGPKLDGQQSDALSGNERAELEALRRENRVLKEERDILKKATAFFAKETTK